MSTYIIVEVLVLRISLILLGQRSGEVTRMNRVDINALRSPFIAESFAQLHHTTLTRGIRRNVLATNEANDRRNINDLATPALISQDWLRKLLENVSINPAPA